METKIYQSLIKRISNNIAVLEDDIGYTYARYRSAVLHFGKGSGVSVGWLHDAHNYKRELKQLVKIQKALKKDFANELDNAAVERYLWRAYPFKKEDTLEYTHDYV